MAAVLGLNPHGNVSHSTIPVSSLSGPQENRNFFLEQSSTQSKKVSHLHYTTKTSNGHFKLPSKHLIFVLAGKRQHYITSW